MPSRRRKGRRGATAMKAVEPASKIVQSVKIYYEAKGEKEILTEQDE